MKKPRRSRLQKKAANEPAKAVPLIDQFSSRHEAALANSRLSPLERNPFAILQREANRYQENLHLFEQFMGFAEHARQVRSVAKRRATAKAVWDIGTGMIFDGHFDLVKPLLTRAAELHGSDLYRKRLKETLASMREMYVGWIRLRNIVDFPHCTLSSLSGRA